MTLFPLKVSYRKKKVKGKKKVLLDKKGFCKKRFVFKDCFKIKRRIMTNHWKIQNSA
jgi:hypothetical protein